MKIQVVAMLTLALLAPALSAAEETPAATAAAAFEPAKTLVAVLPPVNEIGKNGEEEAKLTSRAQQACTEEFANRGFQLLPAETLTKALTDQSIDLSDEENRTKDSLIGLGKSLNVQIVILCAVQPIKDTYSGSFFRRKTKEAVVNVKVIDVAGEKYLVNGPYKAAAKGAALFPDASGSSDLRQTAVYKACQEALKELLKPYKVLPKTAQPAPTATSGSASAAAP